MVSLPASLRPFEEEAKRLIEKGAVGDVEFSGSTYQVQVVEPDSGVEVWAFLQFDAKGRIKDRFCSCEGSGDLSGCSHLAAAVLRIFGKHITPLHVRFEKSLWNHLCHWYAEAFGDDPALIRESREGKFCLESEGRALFSAAGLTEEGKSCLEELFYERKEPTEETSLKFSNLTDEEIKQWRMGRPSTQLRYELSFWNDLAKKLMSWQEDGGCIIAFSYDAEEIPEEILAEFEHAAVTFALTLDALLYVVPSLSTVDSPLEVFAKPEDYIDEMSFDEQSGKISISPHQIPKERLLNLKEKSVPLKDWLYVPREGFYARRKHPLLAKLSLEGHEISAALNSHLALIREKLKNAKVHTDPIELSYALEFDSAWNLSIEAFYRRKGEFFQPGNFIFDEWAYLEGEGFFPLEGNLFKQVKTVVQAEEVDSFVNRSRAWLNTQEGFNTHLSGLEVELTYDVSDTGQLTFLQKPTVEEGSARAKDFGSWIYLAGHGFYAKKSVQLEGPFKPGVSIRGEQLPLFIRMYRDELELIKGFFSAKCPVHKTGLRIELTEGGAVSITPEYRLYPEYRQEHVLFFEEYTYVKGEGFHRLPPEILLPERYNHPLLLEKDNLSRFFAFEMEQLREFAFVIDPRLTPPKKMKLVVERLSFDGEMYQMDISYESPLGKVRFADVWKGMHEKEHYLFTEAGLVDLSQDRFKWVKAIHNKQVDLKRNVLKVSPLELLRLNSYDHLEVLEGKELWEELSEFRVPTPPNLKGLKSALRPYQELGVKWLWFLYHHSLSGILCDDMGLGKTHQAMGLLAAVAAYKKKGMRSLVVCPTSVIYHWEEKLAEYLPGIKIRTFHGASRSLEGFEEECGLLLTSYGIWRKEHERLQQISFELAIFDEIQAAKNQASRLHSSLKKVKAKMRLGLTGTPIENRIKELKALFDIILPGYMPSEKEFRQFFVLPIEKEQNLERQLLLTRFIKPFVTRRKKEDVLFDLPEKTEEVSHCALAPEQKHLYADVLFRVRAGIVKELADSSSPIPYLHIFSALSALKQICNHPACYLKVPEEYKNYRSGKWELFEELMNEAFQSGQKVVVFSQYLAMLDIIELFLQDNNIDYATIRGSTLKRGEQVRRFNEDPHCQVFLGSLHAAGWGIDLTAASVVIHYDRWWNAAREDQATDRVHRIGQTRGVQVFKLVTKDTLEERIDEIILKKGQLMEDVVSVDDHRFMKQFDREEIMQLLKDVS